VDASCYLAREIEIGVEGENKKSQTSGLEISEEHQPRHFYLRLLFLTVLLLVARTKAHYFSVWHLT
jgi:hypothetical protein